MNICLPVTEDRGLQSPVSGHFGSAPIFLIVNAEDGTSRAIANRNLHHEHGGCRPLATLAGENLAGLLVAGIGRGALAQLHAAGIRVYLADRPTVAEALDSWKAGTLRELGAADACAQGHGAHGRGHGGGHAGHPGP
jgi:predicted Fe-Mo cluster-binding NifX family protein